MNWLKSSFEKSWEKAVEDFETGNDPVLGPWDGTWRTETNGNDGRLRCIISRMDDMGDNYSFYYHATWKRFLKGSYRVEFKVQSLGAGRYLISGEKNLGFFGRFEHKGEIRDGAFTAAYSNHRGDLGAFSLSRPTKA